MLWRQSRYQVYAILQLETSDTRKLEAELSSAADSLAVATRRLIIRDRIIGIKFLVDTRADVLTIPVSKRDRTLAIGYSTLKTEQSSLHMDKNYSSLI